MSLARISNTALFVLTLAVVPAAAQDENLAAGETAGPEAAVPNPPGPFSHGYVRFGIGSTDDDPMVAFQLDGAASKYRLGNESDLYGEASLGFRNPIGTGSAVVAEVMLNGWADSNMFVYGNDANSDGDTAQAYFGIEGLGSGETAEAFLWAGRRYYRRRDVHITDFYYENYSNDGIGLESVDFGAFRLSTALFHYDHDDLDYEAGTIDVRFHEIALGGDWLGEVGLSYTGTDGDDAPQDNEGYAIRFHAENVDLSWGEWRNALMYGRGSGINFDSSGNPDVTSDDDRWRFVSQALFTATEGLQTQATAVWQRTEIDGDAETWLSIGARPQYNVNETFGIALEVGYDQVNPESAGSNSLTKVTLAPFYSFGKTGFFARPQLRAFVTWANWNDPGAITQQAALGNSTDGTTVGIQYENWW
ncbi:carbohydrate porin [Tropicimonas isoalkanivorans]|uniref:Maltoporin n=1 Tax=Tropicimonas isoalkanivorans TaxID=441112 RepID=A0A1I1IE03_9RHOB|nr:carbohydrate porin [Tropicimonas isoalkanivorans]SFC34201.1 maltoporin [Tropicimonas isoalkanivorans]